MKANAASILLALTLVTTACFIETRETTGESAEPEAPEASPPTSDRGRWAPAPARDGAAALSAEQRDMIARLEAIGYAAGVQPAQSAEGVVVLDEASALPGAALYVSGHAPEANLIALDGTLLHRWHFPLEKAWPEWAVGSDRLYKPHGRFYFRRAHVFENGDLLVIFEGFGILKIDKHSRLLWSQRNHAHHDFHVQPNGDIYVLTRAARVIPALDPEAPKLEDFIVGLRVGGEEFFRLSLIEALLDSPFSEELGRPDARMLARKLSKIVQRGDILHTNAIEIVRESHPQPGWLKPGIAIVSCRYLSAVLAVDLETRKVIWLHRGDFVGQHEPTLTANGNILLFDNGLERSRAIEIDPSDGRVVWEFDGGEDRAFYSQCCGTVSRLPNGNTQVVVTEQGLALEVTPAGEVAWEYWSPHRAGDQRELVAALFDVVRLPQGFPLEWAEAGAQP